MPPPQQETHRSRGIARRLRGTALRQTPSPPRFPQRSLSAFSSGQRQQQIFFPHRGLSSLHNPHRASASPAPRQGAPGSAVTTPQTAMGRQHGHAGSPSSAGCESCEGNSASSLLSHLEGTRLLAPLHAPSRSAITGSQPGPGTVTGHRAPPRAPPPRRALPRSVRACKRRRRLAVCRMAQAGRGNTSRLLPYKQ